MSCNKILFYLTVWTENKALIHKTRVFMTFTIRRVHNILLNSIQYNNKLYCKYVNCSRKKNSTLYCLFINRISAALVRFRHHIERNVVENEAVRKNYRFDKDTRGIMATY